MPMHDWTRVVAGIYHAFHHGWVSDIGRTLNRTLPEGYYALPEQQAAGFGPDILALQTRPADGSGGAATATRPRPKTKVTVETDGEFFLRKKGSLAIRHVSGDRVVAVVEIVTPGNKNSAHGFKSFIDTAVELPTAGVHLLIPDPFPPGKRDPFGVHAAVVEALGTDDGFRLDAAEPLAVVAYECAASVRGYLNPLAVGDALPDMPAFLEPGVCIDVPLDATYTAAWDAVPKRWRDVVAG